MPHSARTIGGLAQLACTWEVLARKAGNVCPGREFPDLTVADFLNSAAAIAPILDQAPTQPLGITILRCIEETRKVVNTNTNLGIVLLLAPLASVRLDEPLQSGLSRVLSQTTVEDVRNAYAAIRLANPGGLGDVAKQDVKSEPTLPFREVMALAADRDLIAGQYSDDYKHVFVAANWIVGFVTGEFVGTEIERGIIDFQMWSLANYLDTLVARKMDDPEAREVQRRARAIVHELAATDTPEGRRAILAFDIWLRADNHIRNPGTTADLIAAALFVALREGELTPDMPFEWHDHPFAV